MRPSFSMRGSTQNPPLRLLLALFLLGAVFPVVAGDLPTIFLHGTGSGPALFLDTAAPTATTPKVKDSGVLAFSGGNPWRDIGTWPAPSPFFTEAVSRFNPLHVFVGLKNGDDQSARFDLRAEIYKNGALMASGEKRCVTGVTVNPDKAQEVIIAFNGSDETLAPSDTLSLKIRTRIGTTATGAFCGGHVSAIGLRLYFDAISRPSRFGPPFAAVLGTGDWNTAVGGTSNRTSVSGALGPATPSIAWQAGSPASFNPSVTEGDLVVFSTTYGEPDVEARDLRTGALRWTAEVPTAFQGTIRVDSIRGGRVYVTDANGDFPPNYVYSLDAANGSILWRSRDLIGESPQESAAFAANGDPIFGGFYSLSRIDHLSGETVWTAARQCGGNGSCMASVLGNRVYACDSFGATVSVFDVATGEKLYSSAVLGFGGSQSGLIVGPDASVYVPMYSFVEAAAFIALRDTGTALVEKWRIPMGFTPFATFGVGPDGSVYTYSRSNQILRLDPATGNALNVSDPIPFGSFVFPRMAIDAAGKVFFTDGENSVFSFNPDLTLRWSDSFLGLFPSGPLLARDGTLVITSFEGLRAYRTSPPTIVVDGNPADWVGIDPILTDPAGNQPPGRIDFTKLFITNDSRNVYLLLEFANEYATYNQFSTITLDTDMNASTGCNYFANGQVMGAEFQLDFLSPRFGDFLADVRGCGGGSDDFPGALTSAYAGRFLEVSVPIETLRLLTPGLTGFDVVVTAQGSTGIARYSLR